MLYPKNIEQKLGFDQIREFLKQECLCTLGQAYVDRLRFSSDVELVGKMIHQTEEFRKLLSENLNFPSNNYIDVTYCFEKIRPEGSFLESDEFRQLKLSIYTITSCLEFLDKYELIFPSLFNLRKEVSLERDIYNQINAVINDDGTVRDNASALLVKIRKEHSSEQQNLRRETDKILRVVKKEGYAEEDIAPTLRNGRMVIPIKSEYKRKVKGFIHDESATGQTSFIEPAEILEINNTIKELELQEKRELIRILTELTSYLRPSIVPLKKAYTFLGLIDFIRAKAKLAIAMEAGFIPFENKPFIHWQNAQHPLLTLSFKKNGKTVIPLTIQLDANQRILLISGPNAGGKSVCLKTVGLIQYMFQCGLLVPLSEGSSLGFFQDIFMDIGDEQSLENDLSTYSAHLKNMKEFVKGAGKKSLVLIDEFGTGTEPQFGAAIAESVLEALNALNVFGVITTHYSNLKAYADKSPGLINGAMAYNIDKLEPLYILEIGKPGSSYAFEIAKKIGLPEKIIASSKEKVGSSQVDFDKLLRELEDEKNKFRQLSQQLSSKEKKLETTLVEYSKLKEALETNKKTLLKEAKEQAKKVLSDANQKIENTIREIKEHKADKDITKLIRSELEAYKETVLKEEPIVVAKSLKKEETSEMADKPICEGDYVKVKESGAVGEIIVLKEKEAEIMIGSLRSTVKINRLIKISRSEYRAAIGEEFISTSESKNISYFSKSETFSPTLDLRGKRGEEALIEVIQFIDNALILNANDLKIVHGKGDGILRTLIRDHLRHYKQVASLQDEHADRGGAGVTIVKLK
ncbi:MAG TPA: Smr/MutS family protein [Cytophagaceae bacterium]|jgi:DNA mismatch repair protein MutS2|nr:Smr/MutS family protein [Cytophagaceae bacterium]